MKLTKILVSAVVLLCFSFTCIGYASLTDELTVSGAVSYTPPPKVIDYVYVSAATVNSAKSTDKVVSMDGDANYITPKAYVNLQLDFTTTRTRTVTLTITNANNGANYAYSGMTNSVIGGTGYTITSQVTSSNLVAGQVQSTGYIANGTTLAPRASVQNIVVSVTCNEAVVASLTLNFHFGFPGAEDADYIKNKVAVNSAAQALKNTLNGININAIYPDIQDAMIENQYDYVGNVAGGTAGDSELMKRVFGDTLTSLTFAGSTEPQNCTVILKGYDTETGSFWGGDRPDNDYERIIMFITPIDLSEEKIAKGTSYNGMYKRTDVEITVYAVVVERPSDADDAVWELVGDVYKGTCNPNLYKATRNDTRQYCDSFDTDTWRADGQQVFVTIEDDGSNKTYTVADNATITTAIQNYTNRQAVT